jgi:hypothetical protein
MQGKHKGDDPNRGGVTIPAPVKHRTEARIRRYAETHFAGRYTRLEVRFWRQFCYVNAYREPELQGDNWPPPGWPETGEEYLERVRSAPTFLCRLRYFGDEERWGFAFYSYASEGYELAVFPSGEFYGPPEAAFHASAEAYL